MVPLESDLQVAERGRATPMAGYSYPPSKKI